MNLNDYTDNVIDHFMSPRNLGSMVDAAEEITIALGGLPEFKLHCSVLGATAVKNAIDDYRTRQLAAPAAEQ